MDGYAVATTGTQIGFLALPRAETVRRLAIAICLGLVLCAGVAAFVLVRSVDSQLDDIAEVYQLRTQGNELMLALVDAETGQRGYLLTQDAQYLAPYETARASIDARYRALVDQIGDDPVRLAQIAPLAETIARKLAEMAQTIALVGQGQLSDALAIVRSDAGEALITDLRGTLGRFIAGEDARLIARNGAVQAYRLWLVIAILAALAAAATLTYILLTRTQRQVSTLARASTALQTQNEALEEHVRQRTAEADEARAHAERERARVETLLQDTNHRIGNSLATVSSLLGLQVTRTRSAEVRMALDAAQARVHAIAASHRRLRLGSDLETIKADEFLEAVLEDLRTTHAVGRDIAFIGVFAPLLINARDATTLGIVLGELITNALKHAFPDAASGTIWARLVEDTQQVPQLVVEDDGRGLSETGAVSEAGLGATIVKQLARQFGGAPSYEPRPEGGTRVSVTLPDLASPAPEGT